jgi:hypothetical protein
MDVREPRGISETVAFDLPVMRARFTSGADSDAGRRV